jgi:hypothetical protein
MDDGCGLLLEACGTTSLPHRFKRLSSEAPLAAQTLFSIIRDADTIKTLDISETTSHPSIF